MSKAKTTAVLRGFNVAATDIGDQLRLCHPILSFSNDERTLYVARRLNWHEHQNALVVADPSEAAELATLIAEEHRRPMASGEGVLVAGADFVQAARAAGIDLSSMEMPFVSLHELGCSVSAATQTQFAQLRGSLVDEARNTFDKALRIAARLERPLNERGTAALLILRRCGPPRREDLAVRQLAAARQDKDLDLYRRLLVRFALELESTQDSLHRQVERHIDMAAGPRRFNWNDPVAPDARSLVMTNNASALRKRFWGEFIQGTYLPSKPLGEVPPLQYPVNPTPLTSTSLPSPGKGNGRVEHKDDVIWH